MTSSPEGRQEAAVLDAKPDLIGRLTAFADITPGTTSGFSRLNPAARSLIREAAKTLIPAKPAVEVVEATEVSIKPMRLSDGRCDYFVSFKHGGREVTPHVFGERFKAEYHVALYRWLFGQTSDEPEAVEFGPEDWPAREYTDEERHSFAALQAPATPDAQTEVEK